MADEATSQQKQRIVIIYNADGTMMGKLRYGYKKLFPSKGQDKEKQSQPVCGNCDITHGGLSLTETTAWRSSKESLMSSLNVEVVQLHRDELDDRLKAFVKEHGARLPTVLLDDGKAIEEIVPRDQINVCALGKQGQAGSIDEQRATLLVDSIKQAMQEKQGGSDSKL